MTTGAEPSLRDRSLADFLDDVAAATPAPGGGVVAGLTAAAAAGLVAMAARSSRTLVEAAEVAEEADALRVRAVELADRDGGAYAAVLAATSREQRRDAFAAATTVPLDVVRVAARVADLADHVARRGTASLEGDAVTGLLLADAAARSAAHLVRINTQAGGLGPDASLRARELCAGATARAAAWQDGA